MNMKLRCEADLDVPDAFYLVIDGQFVCTSLESNFTLQYTDCVLKSLQVLAQVVVPVFKDQLAKPSSV